MKIEETPYWTLEQPQQWAQETKAKGIYMLNLLIIL